MVTGMVTGLVTGMVTGMVYAIWYIGASFSLLMLISNSMDEYKDYDDDDKMTMTMCRYGRCANGLMCSNCNRCQGCSFQVRLESSLQSHT